MRFEGKDSRKNKKNFINTLMLFLPPLKLKITNKILTITPQEKKINKNQNPNCSKYKQYTNSSISL